MKLFAIIFAIFLVLGLALADPNNNNNKEKASNAEEPAAGSSKNSKSETTPAPNKTAKDLKKLKICERGESWRGTTCLLMLISSDKTTRIIMIELHVQLQDFLTTYKNCNVNLVKIMEKICDTPFIEFDIYNVYEIKQLRVDIREMENTAATKLLEMYKEIVTYIIIVYEGFEAYITQMAEHWIKFVRRYDLLLEDAIRLAIKSSMQNMYKCVHGDGTMAPSPLIKMSLFLVEKDIIFVPNRKEIRETFTTVLEEIVYIMATVSRLFEKFALPAGGLKRFFEVIQFDGDSNKLQYLINEEIEYNITLIIEHIRMWDPYSHIWKVDKDGFMTKYKAEKHSAAEFDELIISYSDLANTVQIQETVNQIHFITLNSGELKKSIIKHCSIWQIKLGELLRKITEEDIDVVYDYVEKSSVDAMKMPSDLKELASAMATYERLVGEVHTFETTFPPITDQMMTLAKFEVELNPDMVTRHENIPVIWVEYLALLEEAKKALEMNKDKFKTELLEQAENASQSGSSENGEGAREIGGSLGIGVPVGGIMGKI